GHRRARLDWTESAGLPRDRRATIESPLSAAKIQVNSLDGPRWKQACNRGKSRPQTGGSERFDDDENDDDRRNDPWNLVHHPQRPRTGAALAAGKPLAIADHPAVIGGQPDHECKFRNQPAVAPPFADEGEGDAEHPHEDHRRIED